ncbi:cytochrome C [Thioalkalivibrio denitrificans]|uniref:Cytochrome C n=1 Tax=Thioalkalivibrio denitrificans TaxID=108003 RepID=A0A1V3NED2_9GAMM|nr:cytochrome C [Thioalkalivibrio denitrificans]OOG23411.1 cytochrome C [Thioalkalivibrio denitrificans]
MGKNLASVLAAAVTGLVMAGTAASEVTYRDHVRPLWEAKCAACHGAESPYLGEFEEDQERYKRELKGPRMDTHADLIFFVAWPDTGALMRRLDDGSNTTDGKPGNMYEHLGETETQRQRNLAVFKAWVGGDDAWIMKRPGEITKEELDRFRLAY